MMLGLVAMAFMVWTLVFFIRISYNFAHSPTAERCDNFKRYHFVLGRSRPERTYAQVYTLVRSLCYAVIPVVVPWERPWNRLMIFGVICAVYLLYLIPARPWRSVQANAADAIVTLALIGLVQVGALRTDKGTGVVYEAFVQDVLVQGSALCGFVVAVLCVALAASVMPQLGRDRRAEMTTYLLVHDEIGMSMTGRWLEATFEMDPQTSLLLSYEMTLEDYAFHIQTSAKAVLVLASPGVLWNPSAGAAITLALGNSVPVVLISVDNASLGLPEDPDEARLLILPGRGKGAGREAALS